MPGVGMDPETVRHCFEKFWQADASGTRRFGGTGIGLYIVRSLTEAMGGTIMVRSELGRGTTFSLRMHAADAGLAIPSPTPVEPTAGQVRRRGRLPRLGRSTEPGAEAGQPRGIAAEIAAAASSIAAGSGFGSALAKLSCDSLLIGIRCTCTCGTSSPTSIAATLPGL